MEQGKLGEEWGGLNYFNLLSNYSLSILMVSHLGPFFEHALVIDQITQGIDKVSVTGTKDAHALSHRCFPSTQC